MQTLSPAISPTIAQKAAPKITDLESTIAQSSALQTALAGLDASLNDELDRYRHWQANGQTISYLNPFRPRAISTQSIWTSPSLASALSPIAPPLDHQAHSDRRTIQMPVMLPIGANTLPSNITSANIPELHYYKGLDTLDHLETIGENFNSAASEQTAPYAQTPNSYDNGAIGVNAPTMTKSPDEDEILQSFANDYANNYANNFQDAEGQVNQVPIPNASPQKSALRSLMNPVGIISILLLLCSSAAIGYLLVDPSGLMKFFKPEDRPKAAQADAKKEDLGSDINLQNQQKKNDSSMSFVPFSADKTQSENGNKAIKALGNPAIASKNALTNPSLRPSNLFVPNNSTFVPNVPLRTVPSVNFPAVSVAPLPPVLSPESSNSSSNYSAPVRRNDEATPASNESTRRTPARSTTSSSSPATSPAVEPRVPAETVAPRNNTAVKYAAPLSSVPAAPAPSYRVVVEGSYAASAQQVERDAYVRPSDGQVQVGSYRDSNAAQQRIEQLRRQGIPAKIE